MSTLFRGITETVPNLYRRIFQEQNSVANPTAAAPSWVRPGSCPVKAFEHVDAGLRVTEATLCFADEI
jgi:hypothetical protein